MIRLPTPFCTCAPTSSFPRVANTPAVDPRTGRIYITAAGPLDDGSFTGLLYGLDIVGGEVQIAFAAPMGGGSGTSPAISPDGTQVYAADGDGVMNAFDAATGAQLWAYETANYVNGTPAIDDGRAIFGGCDAILHVVDVTKGERASAVELGGDCHIAGSAAFVDGRAYFGHYGNQFVCVDVAKGELVLTAAETSRVDPKVLLDLITRTASGARVTPDRKIHAPLEDDSPRALFAAVHDLFARRTVPGAPVGHGFCVRVGREHDRIVRSGRRQEPRAKPDALRVAPGVKRAGGRARRFERRLRSAQEHGRSGPA